MRILSMLNNSLLQGDSHTRVVRCLLFNPVASEEWKHTTGFYTLARSGDTLMKLVIDEGSTMNVVAQSTIKRCNLKIKPDPYPFKVAWVYKTSLMVFHRCKVPIQSGGYKDEILCDVLRMDVAHLLLGRPWLYDRSAIHRGRENTYTLGSKARTSLLLRVDLKSCYLPPTQKPSPTSSSPLASYTLPPTKGTISHLRHKPFKKLGTSNKFYLTVLAREASADHITFPHPPSSEPPSEGLPAEIMNLSLIHI